MPADHKIHVLGRDAGRGNLLGVMPRLIAVDYVDVARFQAVLEDAFAAAAAADLLGAKTVVVLPEHLGTWLATVGEEVAQAATLRAAMSRLALRHLPAFLGAWLASREQARDQAALLRLRAGRTAAYYHAGMRALARQYGVTLVAGSLVLPAPYVEDGVLRAGRGPLRNVSPCYAPDGRVQAPLTVKAYPTAEELPFLTPAPVAALPVYDTPAGRLGVLICADAWFPDCYARLRAQGVELIAVPSFAPWAAGVVEPWQGYSGAPPPADADPVDVGRLTRAEAWRRYALTGRLPASGARAGINVFFQGELWEMALTGPASATLEGDTLELPPGDPCALVNVWL